MIHDNDIQRVAAAASVIPPASGNYLEPDFVMNMLETVVDYMMQTTAVTRALAHFRTHRSSEIRSMADLEGVLARFPDDKDGNTALAQYLWGYKLWTRAQQLRGLTRYFRSIGVIDQPSLHAWASQSSFRSDFEGKIKGLGIAVYQWLIMRQGIETVKPDVHLHRFSESVLGRRLSDTDVIEVVSGAAKVLAITLCVKAYELDWRIWESQRSTPGTSVPPITTASTTDSSTGSTAGSFVAALTRLVVGISKRLRERRE